MVYCSLVVSTIACFMALTSAKYVKLDAKKLKGSWAQEADVEEEPFYGYYASSSNTSNAYNNTVSGFFNDKIYYAVDLAVGSDAQNVTVLVDTLSSDLWINSVDNDVCAKGFEYEPASNFTVHYSYSVPQSSSHASSHSQSTAASKTSHSPLVSTSYSTYYNSASDAYFVDIYVSTETATTTTKTDVHTKTNSYDIQFYPSASSTNWLSEYPQATFAFADFVVENEPQNCSAWGLFNESSSDSFVTENKTFESLSSDDDTIVRGIWAQDYVSYGHALLANVTFGLVNDSDSDSFGALGLGLQSSESTWLKNGSTYTNFPSQLKSAGYIHKVVYSLYENYLTAGSSLLFGGVDVEQFIGNLSVVPLIEVPYAFNDTRNASAIAITLSSIYFDDEYNGKNGSSVLASGLGAAIIDTTAATAALPYYIFNEIVSSAGFNYSEPLDAYVANATELVNKTVVFDFQGVEIEVPVIDLTFPLVELRTGNMTDFVVFGVDATYDTYVLGDAVLQYIYVAVDLDDHEVAIAPKNFFPVSEDIVAVTSSFPNATTAASYNYTYGYHGVTELKLATVNDPNTVSKTSFSLSYIPSVTAYSSTMAPSSIVSQTK